MGNRTTKAKRPSLPAKEASTQLSEEFHFEKDVCALEFWEPIKLLGEGSISDIHLVRRRSQRIRVRYKKKREIMKFAKTHQGDEVDDEQDLFVLKSIMKDHIDDDLVLEEMRREIDTMSKLHHPNIVKLYEAYERRRHVYLVMEYCPGGDLTERHFTEEECAQIVRNILSAVAYMHSHHVVHRDLKLENIMFDRYGEIKIIDFGLATKYLSDEFKVMTDKVGTLYTMAPQVLNGIYTSKCDLWSIGVITYMLLSGLNPFWGPPRPMPWPKRRKIMIDRIMRGEYMRMDGLGWSNVSQDAKNFCKSLLLLDPDERPSAKQALQFAWIRDHGSLATGVYLQRDEQYQMRVKVKQTARKMLARALSNTKILDLRDRLEECDTTGDGHILLVVFRHILEGTTCLSQDDVATIFSDKKLDMTAFFDYVDFIAEILQDKRRSMVQHIAEILDELDIEGTRRVPAMKLQGILEKHVSKDIRKKVWEGVEIDTDNFVSTVQILEMLDRASAKRLRYSLRGIPDKDDSDVDNEINLSFPQEEMMLS